MDSTYPPEAWKRLGKVLEARRGQLGYGFRQRGRFLEDRGGPPPAPSGKMVARLERGERAFYPPATVTRLEALYGLAPGSFEAVLAGGEPVPLSQDQAPAGPPPGPRSREEELIDHYLSRYPDDPAVRALAGQPGRPAALRLADVLTFAVARYGTDAALPAGEEGAADGTNGRLLPLERPR